MGASPGGQYLLGSLVWGNEVGISEISIIDKKRIPLLPGVETQPTRFAPDGKSFLYAVFSRGGVTLYRQAWRDGKLVDKPRPPSKFPSVLSCSMVATPWISPVTFPSLFTHAPPVMPTFTV